MNRRMVLFMLGRIITLEGLILLLPAVCSLIYKEIHTFLSFIITSAIAACIGFVLSGFKKPKDKTIFAKEGFAIVSLAWILMSAIGAIPFVLSGEIPSYVDALFETVSGFTTTGASIMADIEASSRGVLFWRSFTHWVGGMGVLVFVAALLPNLSDRTIRLQDGMVITDNYNKEIE